MAVLFVYMCISFALYLTTNRRLFAYYTVYLLLTGIYVLDKTDYEITFAANTFTKNFNWYLQIIYHVIYLWFSFEFLNYFQHFSKQKKPFQIYSYLILGLGTLMFILLTLTHNVTAYINYFRFVHVPVILMGFIFGIVQIIRVKEPMKYFYIPGMLAYIGFSLLALYLTFSHNLPTNPHPLTYLYLGILIETTMFSIGLGYLIKRTFDKNLQIEKELNNTQKELQKSLVSQLKKQELENENNKMKIQSLQSQMNSHFIFNVLNSLKTFIIENDKTTAVNFLNKYAKLTRIYLEGSQQQINYIDNEIEAVKLYIDIENQRLNNSISFSLDVDAQMNLNRYQIPTHLLIPFLENAIWKGLFYKEENKKLNIKISEDDHHALIQIKDNGHYNGHQLNPIFENEIKNGLHIAEKRIQIYNQTNPNKIVYEKNYTTEGGVLNINIPKRI